jgi:hypothetical protein
MDDTLPCGKHSLSEAETSLAWDGLCPLCQEAQLSAVRALMPIWRERDPGHGDWCADELQAALDGGTDD